MNGLSGGAVFGTLVHEILEHVDTGAPDLEAEVLARCREAAEFGATGDDPAEVARALVAVLRTPLGTGPLAGLTLADVAPGDHLAELDFEIPLAERDSATLARIADLLDEHLPAGDPLAPYAERLREVPGAALRGYLTGSIDSVLRVRGELGDRFTVVDYKTNRLARGDLTTADYTPGAMAREMISSHYVLQALLYSVALHRFLRWKLTGYAPGEHLGVIQYHFVRAMIGPDTPPGAGSSNGTRRRRSSSRCPTRWQGRAMSTTEPTLLETFADAGVLGPADVHVAATLGRLGGETDQSVLLAAALATRAVRLGSVCLELSRLRDVAVDVEGDLDVAALPWPDNAAVLDGLRRSRSSWALRRDRCVHCGWWVTSCSTSTGTTGRSRRSGRSSTPARARRPAWTPRACGTVCAPRSPSRVPTGSGSPPRRRYSGRPRSSQVGPARARRTRWRGSCRCCSTSTAPACGWGWPRPPDAPPHSSPARSGRRAPNWASRARSRRRRSTACSASSPATPAGSATTRATTCRMTWSSWTRRRWSR
ncbi:hypothetical protein MTP03_25630 [Tsukamurella sp. PLM1]|nr:hypothetical protein MTP03_25630 [Tsukamurella sp. PLM1]